MATITLLKNKLPEAEKVLKRIQFKSESFGLGFNYTISNEREMALNVHEIFNDGVRKSVINHKYLVDVVDIEYPDSVLRRNGWEVVAKLDKVAKNSNLVTLFTEQEPEPEWQTISIACEHCNTNRYRTKSFIVKNDLEGYKQVGHTCLKEFTGISVETALAFARLRDLELDESKLSYDSINNDWYFSSKYSYDFDAVLATAFKVVEENGYVKVSEESSTKSLVLKALKTSAPAPEYLSKARDLINLCLSLDYDHYNFLSAEWIKGVAKLNTIPSKLLGLACFLPKAYLDYLEKQELRNQKSSSNHIGQVKEKLQILIKSVRVLGGYQTPYGYNKIYQFTDKQDNIFIWFTVKDISEAEIQSARLLVGTVKEHREFRGTKQTVLLRCKLLK